MISARAISAGRLLPLILSIALICGCDACSTAGKYDSLPAMMEAFLEAVGSIATGNNIAVWA